MHQTIGPLTLTPSPLARCIIKYNRCGGCYIEDDFIERIAGRRRDCYGWNWWFQRLERSDKVMIPIISMRQPIGGSTLQQGEQLHPQFLVLHPQFGIMQQKIVSVNNITSLCRHVTDHAW